MSTFLNTWANIGISRVDKKDISPELFYCLFNILLNTLTWLWYFQSLSSPTLPHVFSHSCPCLIKTYNILCTCLAHFKFSSFISNSALILKIFQINSNPLRTHSLWICTLLMVLLYIGAKLFCVYVFPNVKASGLNELSPVIYWQIGGKDLRSN